MRRGHHDDLAVVRRVGQRLLVAGHAGGEDGLAEGLAGGAVRLAAELAAVHARQERELPARVAVPADAEIVIRVAQQRERAAIIQHVHGFAGKRFERHFHALAVLDPTDVVLVDIEVQPDRIELGIEGGSRFTFQSGTYVDATPAPEDRRGA